MAMPLTDDLLTRAARRELPAACASVLGGVTSPAESPAPAGEGWLTAVPLSGAATGRLLIWADTATATACAGRLPTAGDVPGDDHIAAVLGQIAARVAAMVEGVPEGAGLMAGDPSTDRATAPGRTQPAGVGFDDGTTVAFHVGVELATAAATLVPSSPADSRLEAVLEVDLPLVVRFGRAIMPLRAVADLSPGAVVDMGRTPDEPVDLLVGERLVARGEVVIVGGNYGVRITELTSGRRATDLEARP